MSDLATNLKIFPKLEGMSWAKFFTHKKAAYYLGLFIFIHSVLWTIGPSLARISMPHDTLEGITWGLEWQLGYYKHPFLTAWLCAGMAELFGTADWPIYLLAQCAVALTFFAVWQLAKKLLSPKEALLAVLLLDGVLFYNINSFNLTPDTLQSPLWALLTLFFYQALTTQKIRYWSAVGILATLCLCTKYQVMVLLMPMFFLCVLNPFARISFKKPGLYCAICLFFLLLIPHLQWLYHHEFITLDYAAHTADDYTPAKTYLNHLSYPLTYICSNLLSILGMLCLLWPFYRNFRIRQKKILTRFQWQFLLSLGLGPFFITLLLCALTGDFFPNRWSTPYFFCLGIIAIAYLRPVLTPSCLKQFTTTFLLFSILLFTGRIASYTLFPRAPSDAFLPNKKIALFLSNLWHSRYHSSLPYLVGSSYLISSITPYMDEKPQAYFNWNLDQSPWIQEPDIKRQGGLFIWDEGSNYVWDKSSSEHAHLPSNIMQRFPKLQAAHYYTFHRSSDGNPVVIGVAVLAPQS